MLQTCNVRDWGKIPSELGVIKLKLKDCILLGKCLDIRSFLYLNTSVFSHFCAPFYRSLVKMLPMGEFMDEFFNVAEMFNPLKLTDGEIGLFSSTLIISPGKLSMIRSRSPDIAFQGH